MRNGSLFTGPKRSRHFTPGVKPHGKTVCVSSEGELSMCRLIFVYLTQSRTIWEEGTSTEASLILSWPVSMSAGCFHD